MIPQEYIEELYKELKDNSLDKTQISKLKVKLCKKYSLKNIPTDIEIYLSNSDPKIKHLLQSKPTRSISGVVPVAIMTEPSKCPHGKCKMCPGGLNSEFGSVPQSYTGKEPATMRAIRANFDPYIQVFNRLEQFVVLGHNPEKVELIIMGGTFIAQDKEYIENFTKYAFKAMNDFSDIFYEDKKFNIDKFKEFFEMPGEVGSKDRVANIHKKLNELKQDCVLEEEQTKNETSNIRCVGLTIETRPDWGFKEHGNEMLKLGCTRVELGIQSTDDNALKAIERGHTIQDNIRSIKELKDLGFKLNFHYMLGLPGVTKEQDLELFKQLFENSDFQPDMLKIYPCMVMKGTKLYRDWKEGNYTPLTTIEAAELIVECKKYVPKYCRIMRVQRDIPTYRTEAGVDKTNLRQYVDNLKKEKGVTCNCIRCREIKDTLKEDEDISYETTKYEASGGTEYFIEATTEDDKLLGFCRLRFPSESLRDEITTKSSIVRELHVYGQALAIKGKGTTQHRGIGKTLLKIAEELSKQHNKDKVVVISGIGVREYYKNQGYSKEGPYMTKKI